MSTFRKQFQRVRQNIDQNLGRAEKSEVLSEEEQGLERRVELIKNISYSLHKKLQPVIRSTPFGTDVDRRMKKLPESGLSHTLIESSVQLDQSSASGQIFKRVGELEGKLSQEILHHDLFLENNNIKDLSNTIEVDYPAILKLKKQLNSRTLDMDAAKSRHLSSIRQLQSGAIPQSKVDETRNDYEDTSLKLEQTKDQWATEMYNFSSKELQLNQSLLDLIKSQADLCRKCLTAIDAVIPQIQECLEFSTQKAVFGQELEDHVKLRNNRKISRVIEECVQHLITHGLEEEGLFRIAGSSSKIKKLKSAFNSNISNGNVLDCVEDMDVHVVASVLKLYLRELPEALLRSELFEDWKSALRSDKLPEALKEVTEKMPKVYYDNLRYLVKFFSLLSEHSDVTKMTSSNLGLVLGPNLISPTIAQPEMAVLATQSSLAEALIHHANTIFPGEFDFFEGSANTASINPSYNLMQAHPSTTHPSNKPPQTTHLFAFFPSSSAAQSNYLKASNPDLLSSTTGTATPPRTAPSPPLNPPSSNHSEATLRRQKKSPAPQPPFNRHTMTGNHSPQVVLEKPRTNPPERPSFPPPDKPLTLERPKAQPPPIPNIHPEESSYPYQPSSQPPLQRPVHPQAVYPTVRALAEVTASPTAAKNPVMSQSLYPYLGYTQNNTNNHDNTLTINHNIHENTNPHNNHVTSFKSHQRTSSFNNNSAKTSNSDHTSLPLNHPSHASIQVSEPNLLDTHAENTNNNNKIAVGRNASIGRSNPSRGHPPIPPKNINFHKRDNSN